MTKFCSALLYLENLLTNIFAKLNLHGGVSCMPAALLFLLLLFLIQNIDCGYSLEPPRFHLLLLFINNFRLFPQYLDRQGGSN